MIHSVLIFNNNGAPRLTKFYTPVSLQLQEKLLQEVYQIVNARSDNQCSFVTPPALLDSMDEIRVIYRHYATLYFVFIVDEQESELGILDLIQVFVESLDHCFENVCELDLVFGWQVLQTVLGEIVQGGMVVETNITKIVAAVDEANMGGEEKASSGPEILTGARAAAKAFGAATAAFQNISWPGR